MSKEREMSECCTCGYQWPTGQSGTHSCIRMLKDKIERMQETITEMDQVIHNQVVVMQSALIDAINKTPKDGMQWIYNQLDGPGCLPDENDPWYHDANLYYSAHRSNPYGPCEICGNPSSVSGQGHVACSLDHHKQILAAE